MNLLRTDRTYKTAANAFRALVKVCNTFNINVRFVRYVIAVNEAGRFAPVVMASSFEDHEELRHIPFTFFVHAGITVVN